MEAVHPATVTDDNFQAEVLESTHPVLIDFWAEWCGPCRMIGPIIEELAGEMQGKVKVGKVDVDQNPRVAMEYGIRSIPALLVFHEGKVVDSIVGLVPKNFIVERLQQHIKN
jgi:thioredoxin 1